MKQIIGGRIRQLKQTEGQKWEVSLEFVPPSDRVIPALRTWESEGQELDVIMAER
jgi:hypothetical protein